MGELKELYNLVRKNEILSLSTIGFIAGTCLLTHSTYLTILKEVKPQTPNLARVYEINKELKDKELKKLNPSFEEYINKIKAERDSLESLSTFSEEEEQFESLVGKNNKKRNDHFFYGLLIGLGSLGIFYREIKLEEKIQSDKKYQI